MEKIVVHSGERRKLTKKEIIKNMLEKTIAL